MRKQKSKKSNSWKVKNPILQISGLLNFYELVLQHFFRFQKMAVVAKGNVRISKVLHETKMLSKKFNEKKKIYK